MRSVIISLLGTGPSTSTQMVGGSCHFRTTFLTGNSIITTRVDTTTCQTKEEKLQEWLNGRFQWIRLVSWAPVRGVPSLRKHLAWGNKKRCSDAGWEEIPNRGISRDLVFLHWEITDNFYCCILLLMLKLQSSFMVFWKFMEQNLYSSWPFECLSNKMCISNANIKYEYMSLLCYWYTSFIHQTREIHTNTILLTFFNGSDASWTCWRLKSRWQLSHIIQIRKNKATTLLGWSQESTVL